jgi:hypothetical protein
MYTESEQRRKKELALIGSADYTKKLGGPVSSNCAIIFHLERGGGESASGRKERKGKVVSLLVGLTVFMYAQ